MLSWVGFVPLTACSPGGQSLDDNSAWSTNGIAGQSSRVPGLFRNPVTPSHSASVPLGGGLGNFSEDSEGDEGTSDPWIEYFQGFYYMTYTSSPIEIRQSATLAGLADAQPQVVWPLEGDEIPEGGAYPYPRDSNPWAPEFHRLRSPEDGEFHWYLYYSPGPESGKSMAVLESLADDPLGPYAFKADIVVNRGALDIGNLLALGGTALDATVFTNTDGRLYYLYSSLPPRLPEAVNYQSLWLAEMDNPWTLKTIPIQVSRPTFAWEFVGLPTNEAPEILLHDGKIHLIYSASFCGSDEYKLGRVTVDQSADLLDPTTWLLAKHPFPVFDKSIQNSIYSPGHNGFFTSPDGSENWILFHAHTDPLGALTGGGCFGIRTAHAQKFTYDQAGNPVFGVPESFKVDLVAPSGDSGYAVQFEDADVVEGSRRLDLPIDGDHDLVGEGAIHFKAEAPGDFITYRLPVPAGAQRLKLRLRRTPQSGLIALQVTSNLTGETAELGTQDAYAESPVISALTFGPMNFQAGEYEFRLTAVEAGGSGGLGFVVDQLHFEHVQMGFR